MLCTDRHTPLLWSPLCSLLVTLMSFSINTLHISSRSSRTHFCLQILFFLISPCLQLHSRWVCYPLTRLGLPQLLPSFWPWMSLSASLEIWCFWGEQQPLRRGETAKCFHYSSNENTFFMFGLAGFEFRKVFTTWRLFYPKDVSAGLGVHGEIPALLHSLGFLPPPNHSLSPPGTGATGAGGDAQQGPRAVSLSRGARSPIGLGRRAWHEQLGYWGWFSPGAPPRIVHEPEFPGRTQWLLGLRCTGRYDTVKIPKFSFGGNFWYGNSKNSQSGASSANLINLAPKSHSSFLLEAASPHTSFFFFLFQVFVMKL